MDNLEVGSCKRCGRPVVRQPDSCFVTHSNSVGYPTKRGCRAASFTPGGGWDDSLNRSWTATWRDGHLVE